LVFELLLLFRTEVAHLLGLGDLVEDGFEFDGGAEG
jgi:hypothetical protein